MAEPSVWDHLRGPDGFRCVPWESPPPLAALYRERVPHDPMMAVCDEPQPEEMVMGDALNVTTFPHSVRDIAYLTRRMKEVADAPWLDRFMWDYCKRWYGCEHCQNPERYPLPPPTNEHEKVECPCKERWRSKVPEFAFQLVKEYLFSRDSLQLLKGLFPEAMELVMPFLSLQDLRPSTQTLICDAAVMQFLYRYALSLPENDADPIDAHDAVLEAWATTGLLTAHQVKWFTTPSHRGYQLMLNELVGAPERYRATVSREYGLLSALPAPGCVCLQLGFDGLATYHDWRFVWCDKQPSESKQDFRLREKAAFQAMRMRVWKAHLALPAADEWVREDVAHLQALFERKVRLLSINPQDSPASAETGFIRWLLEHPSVRGAQS